LGSERRATLSPEARRALEGLLAGKALDEVAPQGTSVRHEVEEHLISSLAGASETKRPGPAVPPAARERLAHSAPSPERTKKVVAYSDGASRGNPGPAAIGIQLLAADGSELWSEGRCIGRATNNVAEYHGAIAALEKARELGIEELELRMDSELVVKQLLGLYRVKEPSLQDLKSRVDRLRTSFRAIRFRHVRREENRDTDRLANAALDGDVG
jgi:ribonuclease HI